MSKKRPLILVRLLKPNDAYDELVYRVCKYADVVPTSSFQQREASNQRILLLIRAFFLSYMIYTKEYLGKNTFLLALESLVDCFHSGTWVERVRIGRHEDVQRITHSRRTGPREKDVSAGFALVKEYNPDKDSSGVINEPLVIEYLSSRVNAHQECDKYIASKIMEAAGTNNGNHVNFAVANQVLSFDEKTIGDLADAWTKLTALPQKSSLRSFVMLAKWSASVDDLAPNGSPVDLYLLDHMDGRVITHSPGLKLPDICLFAQHPDHSLCKISIQLKTCGDLDDSALKEAIDSTCKHSPLHHMIPNKLRKKQL